MSWKPKPDIDENVRQWMRAKGWDVNRTEYGTRSQVYSWRHELPGGRSHTLRISQAVLEDYPGFAILKHLDRLNVAAAIRPRPGAQYIVVQNGYKCR